jgi:hypothetical protein
METNPDHQLIIELVKEDRPRKFPFHGALLGAAEPMGHGLHLSCCSPAPAGDDGLASFLV